jgi:hypothetical protein
MIGTHGIELIVGVRDVRGVMSKTVMRGRVIVDFSTYPSPLDTWEWTHYLAGCDGYARRKCGSTGSPSESDGRTTASKFIGYTILDEHLSPKEVSIAMDTVSGPLITLA